MFQVTKNGPGRLDVMLDGRLDSEQMEAALLELIGQSRGIEHGRMLYRVSQFDVPSLGAIALKLSYLPQLLRLLGRFDRVAVLADDTWIRKVSEFEGALLPGLQIRGFGLAQEAEAETWLAQ